MGKKKPAEKTREQALDAAIEEVMDAVDTSEFGTTDVSKAESVEFYEGIISSCKVRIEALNEEIENAEEEADDD